MYSTWCAARQIAALDYERIHQNPLILSSVCMLVPGTVSQNFLKPKPLLMDSHGFTTWPEMGSKSMITCVSIILFAVDTLLVCISVISFEVTSSSVKQRDCCLKFIPMFFSGNDSLFKHIMVHTRHSVNCGITGLYHQRNHLLKPQIQYLLRCW